MTPSQFVKVIAAIQFDGVFNPYSDVCPRHDSTLSPQKRRTNLLSYLETAIEIGVDTLWMGRDLGYRGGRRTGLPLTDEGHLAAFEARYPGSQPAKATATEAVSERTATEIWSKIGAVEAAPFLWNVFPFHPHEPDSPMTNRRYRSSELSDVHELNIALIEMLGIVRVLAIGRDAQNYASKLGLAVEPIRHPSYGGTKEFRSSICRIYPETRRERERSPIFFEQAEIAGV